MLSLQVSKKYPNNRTGLGIAESIRSKLCHCSAAGEDQIYPLGASAAESKRTVKPPGMAK